MPGALTQAIDSTCFFPESEGEKRVASRSSVWFLLERFLLEAFGLATWKRFWGMFLKTELTGYVLVERYVATVTPCSYPSVPVPAPQTKKSCMSESTQSVQGSLLGRCFCVFLQGNSQVTGEAARELEAVRDARIALVSVCQLL